MDGQDVQDKNQGFEISDLRFEISNPVHPVHPCLNLPEVKRE
jgi:hypothetical protein